MSGNQPHQGPADGLLPRSRAWVTSLSPTKLDAAFLILTLSLLCLLVALSFQYKFEAWMFPIAVIAVTGPLLGFVLLRRLDELTEREVLPSLLRADTGGGEDISTARLRTSRSNTIRLYGWIGLVLVMILLIGMEIAIFIFLLVFYRYQTEQRWVVSIGLTLVLWVFIVAVFTLVLGVPMPQGAILELILG